MSLDRSRVFRLRISNSSSILCQSSLHNIISNISTEEESLICEDSISRESGSLEQIKESTGVEGLLSIMQSDLCIFRGDGGKESCSEFEFNASSNLIVEFDFSVEGVRGCPTLSQGDSIISIFSFQFTGNGALLV